MQTMKGKEKETPPPSSRGTASAHLCGDLFAQTVLWTASGPWSQGQGLMMDALVSPFLNPNLFPTPLTVRPA